MRDAFGIDFVPTPLDKPKTANKNASMSGHSKTARLQMVINAPSTWIVPIAVGTTRTVNCGSQYHTGLAQYAADVSMVANTAVYASMNSYIDSAGWNTSGYGNLMKTSTDGSYGGNYSAYYAHLNSFSATPGSYRGAGSLIASSGSTGTSAAHLHFHVFGSNQAVNLAPITNFAENANYPGTYAACGTMSR